MAKKNQTLKSRLRTNWLFRLSLYVTIFCLWVAALIEIFIKNYTIGLILGLAGLVVFIVDLIYDFTSSMNTNKFYYRELFLKTKSNYLAFIGRRFNLEKYNADFKSEEIDDLNDSIDEIKNDYGKLVLFTPDLKEKDFDFKMYDEENVIIDRASFTKNIALLVNVSRSYRNSFLIVTLENDSFNNKETFKQVIDLVRDVFGANRTLIAYRDVNSLFLFIKNIDSYEILKYSCEYLVSHFSIIRYENNKKYIAKLRVSAVVYPFSDITNIISDLGYADKKNTTGVNIYLPRNIAKRSITMKTEVEKLSVLTEVVDELMVFHKDDKTVDDILNRLYSNLNKVVDLLGFDDGGFVARHYGVGYVVDDEYSLDNKRRLFNPGELVDGNDISTLTKYMDHDSTFAFSKRNNLPPEVGQIFDKKGIESGFLYFVYRGNDVVGMLYFINFQMDYVMTTFMREGLTMFSSMFKFYYNESVGNGYANETSSVLAGLLKATGYDLYVINKESHAIVNASDGLKDMYPALRKKNAICYKAIFNRDTVCENCPLKTKKVKTFDYKTHSFEIEARPIGSKEKRAILTLQPLNNERFTMNRFDHDLLIGSFFSFNEYLSNCFVSQAKGYILLARIDNMFTVNKAVNEDGYKFMMKDIVRKIDLSKVIANTYLYNTNTLAFIFNEEGISRIYDFMEIINHAIKHKYNFEKASVAYSPTFFAYSYPQDYTSVDVLYRHMETSMNKVGPRLDNKLFLVDSGVERFASKTKYTLSLLDLASNSHNFDLMVLPMVHASDRTTFGADVYIRLKDALRDTYIPSSEFNPIITRNNKLNEYVNSLVTQLGGIYEVLFNSLYRSTGVKRFMVGADYSYFNSDNFADDLGKIIVEHNFNKHFLCLTFDEDDVFKHFDLYVKFNKTINSLDVPLICYNYTGQSLSLQQLSELGFNEIVLDRSVVRDIIDDEHAASSLSKIVTEAKTYNLLVTATGIDTLEQYKAVKDLDIKYIEGLYISKPLTMDEYNKFVRNYMR
ncbi:MAG: EAL domain-containing protein [Bacilli bacterium]